MDGWDEARLQGELTNTLAPCDFYGSSRQMPALGTRGAGGRSIHQSTLANPPIDRNKALTM